MAKGQDTTPVMRQFLAAKADHPDALVFFRLGDFYELFYEDAVVASKALDLTLTSRNKNDVDPIPMAGVPYHAASGYIQRLLEQGFSVALCEQMADPSKTKGIVPRQVVRVVSPGIAFDDAGLDAKQNHYVAAVEVDAGAIGIAALDLSTGELSACEATDAPSASAELLRLDPREVVAGPGAMAVVNELRTARPRVVVREGVAIEDADARLDEALGKGETQKVCGSVVARRAAARCVQIASIAEAGRKLPVSRLVAYELGTALEIDPATQQHLELVRTFGGDTRGTLLTQLDETLTAPGARLLRRRLLAPSTDVPTIRRRLDAVELMVTQPGLRKELRARLADVRDLERLTIKVMLGRALPRDLSALRMSLTQMPAIISALEACPDRSARDAFGVFQHEAWIDGCADLLELLTRELSADPPLRVSDGGAINSGFDPELDEARSLGENGQRLIVDMESRLREQTSISSLKLRVTRVFGWYIEVTRSHMSKVPAEWRRKQTIATGERYTTDELDTLADKVAHAEERAQSRENDLFDALVAHLATHAERLRRVAARVSEIDWACALAEVAHRHDYCRPDVDAMARLEIEDGRHPVVERLAAVGRFVPNDVTLDAHDTRLWLITGPNMAGKSTLMRQVALIVIMAQMGSFVPARRARIGVVDRVLTRVGASDNLAGGESTFMVEMKETANVLRRATKRSLVVLDEIGRGTSTYDGLAIAWAVAEHLHDVVGCRALFATHYHELTDLPKTKSGCENWSVSAREHEGDIVFLHKLTQGAASRSYGVACARLAGVPEMVIARARVLLDELETGNNQPDSKRPQLDLFQAPKPDPVIEILRTIDPDRLTPIEALTLVASLKKQLS